MSNCIPKDLELLFWICGNITSLSCWLTVTFGSAPVQGKSNEQAQELRFHSEKTVMIEEFYF